MLESPLELSDLLEDFLCFSISLQWLYRYYYNISSATSYNSLKSFVKLLPHTSIYIVYIAKGIYGFYKYILSKMNIVKFKTIFTQI